MAMTSVGVTFQTTNGLSQNILSENFVTESTTDGNSSSVNNIDHGSTTKSYEAEIKALYIPLCILGVTGNCLVLIRYVRSPSAGGRAWKFSVP